MPTIPSNQSAKGETAPVLTQKELQILTSLTEGLSNRALAQEFGVSENTIRTHLRNINAKLEVSSRTHAVAKARQLGLVIR
jgi:LuxR family maltose regulon positive regulatory protein